ncbi:MAG: winged helix-turn-helix transcriptional regulator [Thermoplasmata archaeon]|nr:winged helix-turn-helix transcriptional regulator [Thermoplasmata archaeon]
MSKELKVQELRPEEVEFKILKELADGMRTPGRLSENTQIGSSVLGPTLKRLMKEHLVEPSRMVRPRGRKDSAMIMYRLTPAGLKKLNSRLDDSTETHEPSAEEILREIEDLELDLLDTDPMLTSRGKAETDEISDDGRTGRLYWYTGLILIVVGVVGFVGFSVLHDIFEIPIIGEAFDEFGSINRLAVFLGVVLQAFGISFLFLSEFAHNTGPRLPDSQTY